MSLPHINQINYQVLLSGQQVWNQLLALSVSSEVNRVPRARLEFNYREIEKDNGEDSLFNIEKATGFDQQPKNEKLDFLPGKEIEIKLGTGTDNETVFKGLITKQNVVARNDGAMKIYVECKHICNKMTLQKRTRFHHHDANQSGSANQDIDQVTDEDVLKKLIEHYSNEGLSIKFDNNQKADLNHENMTQYECSDWDFLMIRAEALGYVCSVVEDEIQLISPTLNSSVTGAIKFGEDLFEYEAIYDETIQSKNNFATSWYVEDLERRLEELQNDEASNEQVKIQSDFILNYGVISSSKELELYLSNEVLRQKVGLVQGTAKIKGTTAFKVGDTVTISGFDSVWDRDSFVSGIKHVLINGIWHSHIQFGLSKIPHAEKFELNLLASSPLLPQMSGLIQGKVIQYKNGADGHELLEVEIPAYNTQETTQSIYARMANIAAGSNGGTVFRPYPGDEVVIGFVNNDPRHPIVLGALYNSTTEPPFELDEDTQNEIGFSFNEWKMSINEEEEIMKIASPNGQEFMLDDANECIAMVFDDSNQIKVSSDGIELNGSNITITAGSGGKIEMEALEIGAKADTSLSLEGGTQLELEGKVTASLKGQITQIN